MAVGKTYIMTVREAMGKVSSAFICLLNVSNEIREYSKTWAFTPHCLRPSISLSEEWNLVY